MNKLVLLITYQEHFCPDVEIQDQSCPKIHDRKLHFHVIGVLPHVLIQSPPPKLSTSLGYTIKFTLGII